VTAPSAVLGDAFRDRYTLLRELGRGGMATVYLALDVKLQRRVALKVLRPELAASLGNERFLREIAALERHSTTFGRAETGNVRSRNNLVVASGVYFYLIESGDARRVGRFTLVNFAE
jgi:serine/threonine protein kinase